MGPQEHALRSGDIIIATPGRLPDHMRAPYGKLQPIFVPDGLIGCSTWVSS
jgi:superfamily II DNA/RNA helicase